MVLIASSGYLYTQVLEASSSAQHGPFYITDVLEIADGDLKVSGRFVSGFDLPHMGLSYEPCVIVTSALIDLSDGKPGNVVNVVLCLWM